MRQTFKCQSVSFISDEFINSLVSERSSSFRLLIGVLHWSTQYSTTTPHSTDQLSYLCCQEALKKLRRFETVRSYFASMNQGNRVVFCCCYKRASYFQRSLIQQDTLQHIHSMYQEYDISFDFIVALLIQVLTYNYSSLTTYSFELRFAVVLLQYFLNLLLQQTKKVRTTL